VLSLRAYQQTMDTIASTNEMTRLSTFAPNTKWKIVGIRSRIKV
jgi:hypothetical protein